MNPLVSIITPLFNRQELIKATAKSVLEQEYQNWEWIIVDDGSTDNSVQVVKEYQQNDERIKIYQRKRLPKGASTCRNIGVGKAKGKYLMFLDSDDCLLPHCLKQRVDAAIKSPNMDFWVFQNLLKDESDTTSMKLWNVVTEEETLTRFLKHDALWCICNPMYEREFITKYSFDESLPSWQDYELHIRILLDNPNFEVFYHLPPDIIIFTHTEKDRISIKLKSMKHLNIHTKVLEGFWNTLLKTKQHEKYQSIFLKRFFVQAEYLWDVIENRSEAKKTLTIIKKYNLTSDFTYKRIQLYYTLKYWVHFGKMTALMRDILRKFTFKKVLPKELQQRFPILLGKIDYNPKDYPQT
ncbi:glycosyltransferase [Bernardetia sp. ABR2-2B]|uniref:glycosyltransferase family 2 protein n=1 Tax=Bernardetia sp. ABR2-2B TaxID=3127472 RepID=UPI0030CF5DB4